MAFSSSILRRSVKPILLATLVLLLPPAGLAADESGFQGHWEGTIDVPGAALEVDVDLALQEDGSWTGDISIPVQGLQDLPLVDLSVEGDSATFRIEGIPGEGVGWWGSGGPNASGGRVVWTRRLACAQFAVSSSP